MSSSSCVCTKLVSGATSLCCCQPLIACNRCCHLTSGGRSACKKYLAGVCLLFPGPPQQTTQMTQHALLRCLYCKGSEERKKRTEKKEKKRSEGSPFPIFKGAGQVGVQGEAVPGKGDHGGNQIPPGQIAVPLVGQPEALQLQWDCNCQPPCQCCIRPTCNVSSCPCFASTGNQTR